MVEAAKSGVSVLSVCEKGDVMIMEETGKIFKKEKDIKKGIMQLQYFLNISIVPNLNSIISCMKVCRGVDVEIKGI